MFLAWLFLPFFIWEVNQDRKGSKFVWVHRLTFKNFLQGYSCAEIESVLWSYGIPTHTIDIFVTKKNGRKTIEDSFFVPSNRAFWADTILRQNATKMGYAVVSKPVGNSFKYADKQYKRWGVQSKQKGILSKVVIFFFGRYVDARYVEDLPKTDEKRKKNVKK